MIFPIILFNLTIKFLIRIFSATKVEYHKVSLVLLFDKVRNLSVGENTSSMELR